MGRARSFISLFGMSDAVIDFRSHYINFLKANVNASVSTEAGVADPFEDEEPHTKKSGSADYQQNELSKIAANVWNQMDADQRRPYSEEARMEKEWHKR